MKKVILFGDSIFDNAGYVGPNESVLDQLSALYASENFEIVLAAVDGDVTKDIQAQLQKVTADSDHVFLSCGGNDALRIMSVLSKEADSVGSALEILDGERETFRQNYRNAVFSIKKRYPRLTVCTVYDSVPGMSERALAALSMFNEIILAEAVSNALPVIDLRLVCKEETDYSEVSPIEPSAQGAGKIAAVIKNIVDNHDYCSKHSVIYT